jgi:hypothetical protein
MPTARAIAFVDRTADPNLAAKEVVASRLAFGGKSHCAVDQVFVNEFVADNFLDAVARELSNYEQARQSGKEAVEEKSRLHRFGRTEQISEMQDAEHGVNKGTCKSIWRGQTGLAVEVVDRYVFRIKGLDGIAEGQQVKPSFETQDTCASYYNPQDYQPRRCD